MAGSVQGRGRSRRWSRGCSACRLSVSKPTISAAARSACAPISTGWRSSSPRSSSGVSRCSCSERGAIPACRAAGGRWRGSRPGAAARAVPITLLGVAFAVALPFLPLSSRYLVDLGTTVLIYVMLGWGLNIVVGLAGLLDLGYVAFYAVGAYTFALLARDFGFGFWEALPFSGVMAAAVRHPARLSGVAAARRLSRDRHARLWRDRPPRAAELVQRDRRAERACRCRGRHFSDCRSRAARPTAA